MQSLPPAPPRPTARRPFSTIADLRFPPCDSLGLSFSPFLLLPPYTCLSFSLSPFLSFSLSHATPLSVHKTRILSSTLYVFASIFFLRGLRPLFLLFPRLRTSRFVFCTLRRDKEFLRRIRPMSLNVFTLRHPSLTKQPRSIAGIQGYFPNFDKYSEVSANGYMTFSEEI